MILEGFGPPSFYSFQFWWYGPNRCCVASIPHARIALFVFFFWKNLFVFEHGGGGDGVLLCPGLSSRRNVAAMDWLTVIDLLKDHICCSYFFIEQCSILCTVGMINRPEHFRLLAKLVYAWIWGGCHEPVDFPDLISRNVIGHLFFWSNSLGHFCLYDFLWHIPSPH